MTRDWFSRLLRPRTPARRSRPRLEPLEDRALPSVVTVNATQVVRTVNAHDLGVNLAWWDGALTTTQTEQLVQNAGLTLFRFPGGSSSDTWHFNNPPAFGGAGVTPTFASLIQAEGGDGMVTLDYGSGSPQEAAAFLAYCNGSTGNTTALGSGPEWSDASGSWVTKDWRTAGYWAGLRAAAPLTQDDGLNFLRVNHPAPFNFTYFEVGNEIYGNWETDHHTTPHDPATYVQFAKQFAAYAAAISPGISIGVDGSGTGGSYSQIPGNWTAQVLQQCAQQGFTPGFVSDHNYMFDPGHENDANLLLHSATDPNATGYGGPINWAGRAQAYRNLITQYLGSAGAGVQLLCTEFNSVSSNPSNQTTSLVNGLWLADALGGILQTEYNSAVFWDLRNGYDTSHYNSSLYGWRTGGDYGILGSAGTAPATGTYVPYPTYFAEQLVSKIAHNGDQVIRTGSNDSTLSAYAVKEQNGHVELLVVNKNPGTDLTEQIQLTGFTPNSQATVWQYGKTQDTAQSHTTDGHSSLGNFTQTLSLSGSSFGFTFPQYSMTVLDLAPAVGPADPGFELPHLGTGPSAYQYDPSGSPWTFTGSSGVAGNGSAFTGGNPNAPEGTQVAFLQGYGGVSQSVTFPAGYYNVSFTAAQRASNSSSQTFQVLIDGSPVGTFTPAFTNYTAFNTNTFAVAAGAHTVTFVGLNPDGQDNTALLDQVRVSRVAAGYGFELPNVGGGYQYDPTGTPLSYTGDAGVAGNGSALGNPNAPQGSQVGFLQDTGGFSATGNLAAGTYSLTFEAAQWGGNTTTERFQVLVDGVVVGDFTPAGTSFSAYTTAGFTVPTGGMTHTVQFVGLGGDTVFLDQLQLLVLS